MQTVPLHATRGLVSSPQATSPMHAIPFTQKTRCTRGSVQKAQAFQRNIDLLRALFEQAQRETAPWVQDLVQPARALGTTLPPLPDTQDSRTLGDHDSCFIQLDDLTVHYKEVVLGPTAQQHSTSNGFSQNGSGQNAREPSSISTTTSPPAILLLHGFNGSVFNWRFMMHDLAAALHTTFGTHTHVRVIAFDRPPFGLTTRPRVTVGGGGGGGGAAQQRNGSSSSSNADMDMKTNNIDNNTNNTDMDMKTDNTNNTTNNTNKTSNTNTNTNPYTPSGAAHIAVSLLQSLGVSQAIVVGHSAGAGVAMEIATRYPTHTAGLVFICPALADASGRLFTPTLGTQLRLAAMRLLLSRDDTGREYVRRVIGKRRQEVLEGNVQLYGDGSTPDADAVDGYLRPMRAHDWDIGMLETMRVFSLGSTYDYPSLPHPVLFIQGQRDEPLGTQARKVYATLAQRSHVSTRYVELPRVGHIPMEEAAGETVGAVEAWLWEEFRGERRRGDASGGGASEGEGEEEDGGEETDTK